MTSRLILFIEGLAVKQFIPPSLDALDSFIQSVAVETSMDKIKRGLVRVVICNTTVPFEEVVTWTQIQSKQKGGIESGNYKSSSTKIEEINLAEVKRHVDVTYKLQQLQQIKKRQEIKEKVLRDVSKMSNAEIQQLKIDLGTGVI